jgi:phosphoribosyl-dephospho-CoA transferase
MADWIKTSEESWQRTVTRSCEQNIEVEEDGAEFMESQSGYEGYWVRIWVPKSMLKQILRSMEEKIPRG